MTEVSRLDDGALAARVRQLYADTGHERLEGGALIAWQELESREPPSVLLWVLEEMKGARVDLPLFVESLALAGTPRLAAVLHYASYLRERRRHERAKDPKRSRTPRRHTSDTEPPRLEL
jgi:hypothetical protein